jgi:hypothetical protein
MDIPTIRISRETHQTPRQLAEQTGTSMSAVLEAAVRGYQRSKCWEALLEGYAALRADPEKWADYQKEIGVWDVTLGDGLEDYD